MGISSYNPEGYIIRIGETALMQMCLGGLEAYSVSHRGNKGHRTGLETYGLLFGHESLLPGGRTLYCIELADTEASAERTRDSCTPNPDSLILKRDVLTSFFPQYEFMGDWHTHPFTSSRSEILRKKCYRFSHCDHQHIEGFPKYWRQHNYRVGMVVTISMTGRTTKRMQRAIDTSTIELALGNYRLFIKGYVAVLDVTEKYIMLLDDGDVSLRCPSLPDLHKGYTEFGKGKKTSRIRHVCGNI